MAKSINRQSRRQGQAQIRRGRQILSDTARLLKQQEQERRRAQREADKAHRKQQKHLAALLRRAGAYKPKGGKRITNDLIKRSGSLRRKLRELQQVLAGHETANVKVQRAVKLKVREEARQRDLIEHPEKRGIRDALREAEAIKHRSYVSPENYTRLVRKIIENPDSFLKIMNVARLRHELYTSRDLSEKDFSKYDYLLPDDWEEWYDAFPELGYYHDDM